MKTFGEFQESAAALRLASKVLPAILTGIGAAGTILQARKQGEGKRSQPVDYGQGEGSKPRTQATVRPTGPKADYKARLKAQQQARREEVRANREERAQQGIDSLIGSDAERKAAAEARANQPETQRRLRQQSMRERMRKAAEARGLD